MCQVNAGEYGTMQICCGADNVQAGGKYPVALVGATVYATAKDHKTIEGVMTIKRVSFAVLSHMVCFALEQSLA